MFEFCHSTSFVILILIFILICFPRRSLGPRRGEYDNDYDNDYDFSWPR
jgi:hypothetical protein